MSRKVVEYKTGDDSEFIHARSYTSDQCLTALSMNMSNTEIDYSMPTLSSAAGTTSHNSSFGSTESSSSKLSSLPTSTTHEEPYAKQQSSSIKGTDMTQCDDYDVFANKLMKHMIDNLRTRHLNEDDARVILMRRGETLTEVFPDWTVKAFDEQNIYTPFDLNMPRALRKRENIDDFLLDPPLTNISAHFAAELGFSMTQNLPTVLYSAPEMAVVQTARQLLDGAEIGMTWRIEPGLVRYFSSHEKKPTFIGRLQQETIYTMESINEIIGNETIEQFHKRIAEVVSKLKFPRAVSTIIVAEDCVINAIIQAFIRNGTKLTAKQQLTLNRRIPRLSMIHFDINNNGKWKPSCASLPGLGAISRDLYNIPDINFLIRPTYDF